MVSWPKFLDSSTSMSKDNITSTFGLQLRPDQRKTFQDWSCARCDKKVKLKFRKIRGLTVILENLKGKTDRTDRGERGAF